MELAVPYVSQVPDGAFVAPWDEACEEASITMVNGFYQNKKSISKKTGKAEMQRMFDWEDETFKNNQDTTAEETVKMIEQFGAFRGFVKRSPTLEGIKRELDAQRPVIALVNMFQLYNEPALGDSFHVFVITGYDDQQKEFILHDPARSGRRYSYERVLSALHDYNPVSKEADAEATVIFTEAKPRLGIFSSVINFFKRLFT